MRPAGAGLVADEAAGVRAGQPASTASSGSGGCDLRHGQALALLGRGDRVRAQPLEIEPLGLGVSR